MNTQSPNLINKPNLLFLTTSSLATNPRLVKEFELLKDYYRCVVVCYEHQDWSLAPSNEIIKRNADIEFVCINRRQNLKQTLLSKLSHKVAIILNRFYKSNPKVAAYASNDKTPQLCLEIKKLKNKRNFDTVIAHNLGSFYPALKLAKKSSIKLQVDIEDYHPGEEFYFNEEYELQNRLLLMQLSLINAHAITYASEGIKQKCEANFELNPKSKTAVIINAFRSSDFLRPHKKNEALNFVWFSQNISQGRGLEEVFSVAKDFPKINFHIIGKANDRFIEDMQPSNNVCIHKPLS